MNRAPVPPAAAVGTAVERQPGLADRGTLALDHLVVAAASLEQGARWCEQTLGVSPGPGGQHPLMGTHNRLLRIDGPGFAQAYLEIIAIDPQAPPPGRARWFGLDDAGLQARIAQQPELVHLVARCADLDQQAAAWRAAGVDPGDALQAGRDTPQGRLQWRIAVRADGSLGCGGALPTLIEWQGRHPAASMPASPVRLQSLVLRGLPEAARALLQWQAGDPASASVSAASVAAASAPVFTPAADHEAFIRMSGPGEAAGPALVATLHTPLGPVDLGSR